MIGRQYELKGLFLTVYTDDQYLFCVLHHLLHDGDMLTGYYISISHATYQYSELFSETMRIYDKSFW